MKLLREDMKKTIVNTEIPVTKREPKVLIELPSIPRIDYEIKRAPSAAVKDPEGSVTMQTSVGNLLAQSSALKSHQDPS